MPIVFTSTPLPANGNPRTAASEAAIFTNIANTYNAYETAVNSSLTSINAILATRTNLATVSSLMQRDVNGDFNARDSYLRSVIGSGVFYGGALAKPFTDSNGFIRADALPVIPSYLIDQLNPSSIAALRIDWTTGWVTDTAGIAHNVAAGSKTYNDAPNPTTQNNWGTTYVDKASGAVTTVYAAAANAVTPSTTLPVNCRAIADVYLPINAAGVIVPKSLWAGGTQPFFLDGRQRDPAILPTGGGGGSSVTFAAVLAALGSSDASMLATTGVTTPFNFAEWANGSAPSASRNGIVPSNIRVKESLIAADSTQGTLEDANYVSVTGNLDAAIKLFTNYIRIDVDAGSPPITFKNGGKRFSVFDTTAVLDTPTISAIDLTYTLYANVATGAFVLASSPPTGNYIPLRDYFWDGSTFYLERDRVKPTLNSLSVIKYVKRLTYPAAINAVAATAGAITDIVSGTAGMVTFQLPTGNWRAQCKGTAAIQTVGAVGTTPDFRFYTKQSVGKAVALTTPDAGDFAQQAPPAATAVQSMKWGGLFENLSGGYQNFGIGYYYLVGGSPGAYNILYAVLEVEISRM